MITDGRIHDIDKDDLDRWCEYIFYRELYRTAYARISRGSITDTELQVGQFVVPSYGTTTGDIAEADRYLRGWKEELPKEHVRRSLSPAACEPICSRSSAHAGLYSGFLTLTTAARTGAAYGVTIITSLTRCVCYLVVIHCDRRGAVQELTMRAHLFFFDSRCTSNSPL
jgi:hypothetical protein